MINEHMVPDKDLKLLFKEFEGLYVNEMGTRHNTNRQKLKLEHSNDFDSFVTKCSQVINDMKHMAELVKRFPIALVNSRKAKDFRRNSMNDLVSKLKTEMSNQQQEYLNNVNRFEIRQFIANPQVQNAIIECENIFDEILDSYYISYDAESILYFKEQIERCKKEYSKNINLTIQYKDLKEGHHKYYYWNASIEKEFLYMLANVEHCNTPLREDVMMDVEIIFQPNKILIKFVSWSEKIAEQVKHVFLEKNRLSKEQARAFDVIFDFDSQKDESDTGEFLLESKMSVPACFPQLS